MSMTEQEIRADERNNMIVRLRAASMVCTDGAVNAGIDRAIFDILWKAPEPEPKITSQWFDYCWGAHNCTARPKKVGTPTPQGWRDVPVTAGMLWDAIGPGDNTLLGVIGLVMAAAMSKAAP